MANHSGYFRVAVLSTNSNFIVNVTSNGNLEVTGGYEAKFLDMLSTGLRLKPVIHISDEWGTQTEDGNWTGLIGMVQQGEVDMAISSLLITEARMKVVDFSYPYSFEDVTFATRKPGTISTATALIRPFSFNLWIALIASLIVFSLVFHFLMYRKGSFCKTLFDLFGYVLNQASTNEVQETADRFLIGAWICGTIFLSKMYSSFLLSFLTLPIKEQGVKDINQLSGVVAAGAYKCFTSRGSSLYEGLAISEQEPVKIIAESIKMNDWLLDSNASEFEEQIRMENSAIIRTRRFIRNIFQDDVFISDDFFYSAFAAIVLQKNSTLKFKINHLIHRISASAVYLKAVDHYLFQKSVAKIIRRNQESIDHKISLEDVKGAILFLIAGHLLSTVVCFLEVLWNLWKTSRQKSGSADQSEQKISLKEISQLCESHKFLSVPNVEC